MGFKYAMYLTNNALSVSYRLIGILIFIGYSAVWHVLTVKLDASWKV